MATDPELVRQLSPAATLPLERQRGTSCVSEEETGDNKTAAARLLGITRRGLYLKLRRASLAPA